MALVNKIGQTNKKPSSTKDRCCICSRKTMANAVLCKYCGNWIHGKCLLIKRVTNILAIDIKCRKCIMCHENEENKKKKLNDDVETVTRFSYLDDRINL